MKTLDEAIEQAVTKSNPHITPAEKEHQIEMLRRTIEEGRTPTLEDLGLTREMLNNLYVFTSRLYNSGKYEDASSVFAMLALLDDKEFDYPFALASCHHMLKQYSQAISNYMLAFNLDNTNPLPFYHIADCYMQMKKPVHAIHSFDLVEVIAKGQAKYNKIKERATLTRDRLIKEIESKI
ncbi:MAG: SycD/LcrH family type III secretion system chaperone [Parachlamydiaceae bacterium]|nr:SycD/LcrH family type III secretion system chaperone [Parachlamydiaceae bacterium]